MKHKGLVALVLLVGWLMGGCVGPNLLPEAVFTLTPDEGPSPLSVVLDASGSISPDGVISQYVWDFGDGTSGSGMIVSHSYQTDEKRSYTITLQVVDHKGESTSSSRTVTVLAPIVDPEKPSVDFVWPFHFDAAGDDATNLNDEYFTLQNTGNTTIDLSGWRVENKDGMSFRVPSGVSLAPGVMMTIHSGSGVNTTSHLYLNATGPIWDNNNDLAFLLDAEGQLVIHYVITTC